VLTLVRRDDGRVRFLVCENLQDADENIAEYGDGSVIFCTDDYTIYNDIEDKEGVDGHLAVTYSDTIRIRLRRRTATQFGIHLRKQYES
jgi:hypothetical protein